MCLSIYSGPAPQFGYLLHSILSLPEHLVPLEQVAGHRALAPGRWGCLQNVAEDRHDVHGVDIAQSVHRAFVGPLQPWPC